MTPATPVANVAVVLKLNYAADVDYGNRALYLLRVPQNPLTESLARTGNFYVTNANGDAVATLKEAHDTERPGKVMPMREPFTFTTPGVYTITGGYTGMPDSDAEV